MEILIKLDSQIPGLKKQEIKRKMAKLLEDLGFLDKELSILLTSDQTIARLNEAYLGRQGPTNVIAFPMEEQPQGNQAISPMLGDIVVSVDMAIKEAKETGESVTEAIDRLLIHGLLHLAGYDHENSEEEARRMRAQEERLMALIKEG